MTQSVADHRGPFHAAPHASRTPCGKSAAKRSSIRRSNSRGLMSRWSTAMPRRAWTGLKEYMGEPDDIVAFIGDAPILVTHLAPLSAAMMDRLPQLKLVAVSRGGPVNIDIGAARERGIQVVNTPGRNASAVAEFAIGAILSQTRMITRGHDALRRGDWRGDLYRADLTGDELSEMTVGVVGYGHIGTRVVRLLKAFGCRILVCDPYVQLAVDDLRDGVEQVSLDRLLAQSDVVSLHPRVTEETRGMIGAAQFAAMKPGSLLRQHRAWPVGGLSGAVRRAGLEPLARCRDRDLCDRARAAGLAAAAVAERDADPAYRRGLGQDRAGSPPDRLPRKCDDISTANPSSIFAERQELTMADTELHLRKAIIDKCRWMNASGLNQGTSGNISARHGDTMLISPSATPYDSLTPDMIAAMPIDGEYGSWQGPLKPSTRMAVSSRHHESAAGCRRHRPHPCDLFHGAGDRAQGNSGLPLHDGGIRRHECARCRLRPVRHQGTVGACAQGVGEPDRVPARKPRDDRDRHHAGQGDVAGGRTRDHRQAVLSHFGDRRPGPAQRSRHPPKPPPRSAAMACRIPRRSWTEGRKG